MSESAITPFAWIFMLSSMGAVSALAGYCYWRILFASDEKEVSDPASPPTPTEWSGE